jgi:hypothetical protein
VYLQILRGHPLTLLQQFDQPVMEINCLRRGHSTVSTQALTLLNSDTVVAAAEALADRVLRGESTENPIAGAMLVAFSRQATPEEIVALTSFIAEQQAQYVALGSAPDVARRRAFVDLCHMLLAANEFVYVD